MHILRRPIRFLVGAATLLLALSGRATPVRADNAPKLRLERADVSKYPILQLYLTYVESDGRVVTGKSREDFRLIFDSNEQGTAADVKLVEQTGDPIYLMLVAQVSGVMGEVFEDEKRGVLALAQATSGLKGSRVGLITYAQDFKRTAELGKPSELAGKMAQLVVDTEGTEVHLLDAVRTAIDLLNGKGVPDDARKMIVIFSDGIDVAGAEKKLFAELGRRALQNGIVIDTIGYGPFEKEKLKNLAELAKQSSGTERVCTSAQELTAQFANTADAIRKQYVVVFSSVVPGQGLEHTIQVVDERGQKPVYSNNITKVCEDHGPAVQAPTPVWKRWWFWVSCVGGLVALVLLIGWLRGRRAVPPLEQAPEEAPPQEMPQRTVMMESPIGRGPTIGWIVGINGDYVDRTFKLKTTRTVIGTAPDCDVIINDRFMSTKHCEVRYDGTTYRIYDLGSTNGILLNDKKVTEHDLVDGDTLRLGQTEFRFKSIN